MTQLNETVGLPAPTPSFPVKAFDAVNQRMSGRTSGMQESAWHGFAAAWNAIAYRLIAAHRHANRLHELVARPVGSPEERFQQDHELFCWAAATQSAMECAFFAAQIVAMTGTGEVFEPTRDADLRFLPSDVAQDVAQRWPNEAISRALRRQLKAIEFRRLSDLRRVLFHRGTLPRKIFASTTPSPNRPDAIPSNPADPADQWRYDLNVSPGMTDALQQWCDTAIAEIIGALSEFTAKWERPEQPSASH